MNKPIDKDWIEELNARIDEAEEQIARGEVLTADEADLELKRFLASLESQ